MAASHRFLRIARTMRPPDENYLGPQTPTSAPGPQRIGLQAVTDVAGKVWGAA